LQPKASKEAERMRRERMRRADETKRAVRSAFMVV
jgi:hypothetical protein